MGRLLKREHRQDVVFYDGSAILGEVGELCP